MEMKSKYNIDQPVYKITNRRKEITDACLTCKGKGSVIINQTPPRACPDCYGQGTKISWEPSKWLVDSVPITIGCVKIQAISFKQEVKYMCYETGIGSGRRYYEKDLFVSRKEAEDECAKRNSENEN